eukprot:CAMPEP_0179405864 /NCGR_PEP_ID=MMETSP0799-20121207/539_1 /TAXON_ID=46947 /ORGANISM="Geminigera cryophila, Strain CCMP2564" /LENGTH=212 /DNA_ID=CAMNT_0021176791 /DNA_START=163 /DNA_END=802 /DNA_ORIENTATION=-
MEDNWKATMQDVGDFANYIGGRRRVVGAVPAADGLNQGVKGLPLPGHDGGGTERGFLSPRGRPQRRGAGPIDPSQSMVGWGNKSELRRPSPPGGKVRMATVAGYGRPPTGAADLLSASHQPYQAFGVSAPALPSPAARSPSPAARSPSPAASQQLPDAQQPPMRVSAGLGLPRAGFSSSFGRSTTSVADQVGAKPRLSGYYGDEKTGGMSVA